ncbi:hypothetical protein J1N44_17940 [Acidovorax temperans]|uniref:hypothetical protein n=1 Tax=Acidovorax temperans TaxID=80878 RepID=UPI001A9465CB|nr:hypothetical protein [Acidovorax temperans]MBO0943539.1 hypothetical protein [Acidovorax temperans]
MALSDHGQYSGVVDIARNGIDEVIRLQAQAKQDEALIRQMLEALNTCDESDGYTGLRQFFDEKAVESAITAAIARLSERRNAS